MQFRPFWLKVRAWVIGITLASVVVGILIYSQKPKNPMVAVKLTGVHHLGPGFNIPQFYVDKGSYSGIQPSGSGGAICCVMLPTKWRPGLSLDVRWEVDDWRSGMSVPPGHVDFDKIVFVGLYRAQVPVEKYDSAEDVYVHIFPDGKARVVSSPYYQESSNHPIQRNDLRAADSATVGGRIDEILSKSERIYLKKKHDDERRKYGDWR